MNTNKKIAVGVAFYSGIVISGGWLIPGIVLSGLAVALFKRGQDEDKADANLLELVKSGKLNILIK